MASACLESNSDQERLADREIRLLSFQRIELTGALVCSIDIISLDQQDLQYHALSYAWSEATEPRLPGEICFGRFSLRNVNLCSALQDIWTKFPTHFLWVDKLCIRQGNIQEKNSQLELMSDIYMKADEVHVWLGRPTKPLIEEKQIIFNMMQDAQVSPSKMNLSGNQRRVDASGALSKLVSPGFAVHTLLLELANRQWFWRTWTFQELKLARRARVWYGSAEMSWSQFKPGFQAMFDVCYTHLLSGSVFDLPDNVQRVALILKPCSTRNQQSQTSLATLLLNTSERCASDPRDKVYGLLSLHGNQAIKADYGLTTVQVYCMAVKYTVTVEKTFALLELVGIQEEAKPKMLGLPSWVPDLSHLPLQAAQALLESKPRTLPPLICTQANDKHLVLRGILLGIVLRHHQNMSDGVSCTVQAIPICVVDGYRASLCASASDIMRHESPPTIDAANLARAIRCHDQASPCLYCQMHSSAPGTPERMDVGTGVNVLSGDWLCLFHGCDRPCVLQPSEVGTFHLVGWGIQKLGQERRTRGSRILLDSWSLDSAPCFCTDFVLA